MRTGIEERFPPVSHVYPILPLDRRPSLGYVIRAGGDEEFNNRHKEILEEKLRKVLGIEPVVSGSGEALTVTGIPHDSTDGRFTLLEAIHHVVEPHAPFTALGILLSSSINVTNYLVELQLLGAHSEAVVQRIGEVISDILTVDNVARDEANAQTLVLAVNDDWRAAETTLLLEMQARGIGVGLHVDTTS